MGLAEWEWIWAERASTAGGVENANILVLQAMALGKAKQRAFAAIRSNVRRVAFPRTLDSP